MPLACEIATHPAILEAVSAIIGPNVMVWGAEFFIKEAGSQARVSWHQDLTYWGMGETDGQVTAWLALSPATLESGCMKFVAGSHKNRIVPHNDTFAEDNMLSRGQEIAVEVNEDEATAVELQPGEMSLHHGLMFHGSGPNVSNDRRIAFVVRYVRPDISRDGAGRDFAMLVKGVDEHGHFANIAPAAAPFAPERLALYDYIRDEQAKTLGAGSKKALYEAMPDVK